VHVVIEYGLETSNLVLDIATLGIRCTSANHFTIKSNIIRSYCIVNRLKTGIASRNGRSNVSKMLLRNQCITRYASFLRGYSITKVH